MKKLSIIFLQGVVVLVGIVTLAFMIRFPLTEGRAANLDLLSIYADPLIIYGYVASTAFFVALYQTFKLLRYIGQDKILSSSSIKTLKTIKYSAFILGVSIVIAALYILIFHAKDDDPAGFIAMSIVATFISVVVGTIASVLEQSLQKALNLCKKEM